jgi:hypothetical protein
MSKDTTDSTSKIVSTIFALIFAIPSFLLNGYIVSCFWVWFIVRIFPNLPHINFLEGCGIIYMVNLVYYQLPAKNDELYSSGIMVCINIVRCLILWLGGFILHCFLK